MKLANNLVRVLLLAAVAVVLAIGISAPPASSAAAPTFSGTGSLVSNSVYTVNYYVVPASGNFRGAGVARVQYINVTGDKSSSQVQFYKTATNATLTATPATPTNVLSASLTSSATAKVYSNSVCVIWNVGADTYQRLTITNNTATTISFRENTTNATAGDRVFVLLADAVLPVGVNTKEFGVGQEAVYSGVTGQPVLVECNAGTNSPINCISGVIQ